MIDTRVEGDLGAPVDKRAQTPATVGGDDLNLLMTATGRNALGPQPVLPSDKEELRRRAVALREDGLSTAQIAHELGVPRRSTVAGWLVGIPPPEWTRRPRAKDQERERARELRRTGLTYDEIAATLHVSKSSVSLWTRDLPRPERRQNIEARLAGLRRYLDDRTQRVFMDSQNHKLRVAADFGRLSPRELLIAGAVAYWAEGTKWKPWRCSERVTFVNSDPHMVRLFITFLWAMSVDPANVRYRVQIHESADVAVAEAFWAAVVEVPVEALQRTTLKRHSPTTNRKNVSSDYHGCLSVTVHKSAALYRQIEGLWWAVRLGVPRTEPQVCHDGDSKAAQAPRPVDPRSGLPPRLARFRRILRKQLSRGVARPSEQ